MADRKISQLTQVGSIGDADLFVVEQSGAAMSVSGETLKEWLLILAEGNGGISKITGPVSSGTNPVVDTYTIYFESGRTKTFTVTNGVKGDTGATGPAAHIYIRYAAQQPTADNQMSTEPDMWMGICISSSSTAPSQYTAYTWYRIRGTGIGSVVLKSGDHSAGTTDTYDVVLEDGVVAGSFTVRNGVDGTGAVSAVNGQGPDSQGNVTLAPGNIGATTGLSLASEYSDVLTYSVGDYVIHGGQLYVCSTAVTVAEAWNGTKWTAVSVANCKADSSKHGISTYNSVSQLGLTSSIATIAGVWAAIPDNSILVADATQFLSTELPSANGTVEISKAAGAVNGGWIAFYGKTAANGRYEMHLNQSGGGTVPDGTWVGLLPASSLSFSRSGSLYLATVSNLSYADSSLRYALNADGSIGKIYGSVTVTVGSSFSGSNASIAVYTDSGKTTRLTVASPSSGYTINTAGVTFRNSSTGTNISDVQRTYISTGNIGVDTSGRITLELSSLTYSGSVGNVHHYQYPASLYIFADFGDPVINNS